MGGGREGCHGGEAQDGVCDGREHTWSRACWKPRKQELAEDGVSEVMECTWRLEDRGSETGLRSQTGFVWETGSVTFYRVDPRFLS